MPLTPDPAHFGAINIISLISHDKGKGQEWSNGCWVFGFPEPAKKKQTISWNITLCLEKGQFAWKSA